MSDVGQDILNALSILSGSAEKMQNASLIADTSIAKSNSAVEIQQLENEQYAHKSGLNLANQNLNNQLDRQEKELKDLNKFLVEREISFQDFQNISEMDSTLEGNRLWEERGNELQNDLLVWGDVTTNALDNIDNLNDAKAINNARIDQLQSLKNEYLKGAAEAALVGTELHNEGMQDRADFDEYVKNNPQMDGIIDTVFEYGFESKRPTVENQINRDASIASLVTSGLRQRSLEQNISIDDLRLQEMELKIDNLQNDKMWKDVNRFRGVATSLYNMGDYDGATQYVNKINEILGEEYTLTEISGNSNPLTGKTTKNEAPFPTAFKPDVINEINTTIDNSLDEFNTMGLSQKLIDSDYYQGQPYKMNALTSEAKKVKTPKQLKEVQEKVLDVILYDLSYASDGELDYYWKLAGGSEVDNKNVLRKTNEDFKGYAEKREWLNTVMPYLLSAEKYPGGGKGKEYNNMGLIADAKTADMLDFYTENPFNPDDYSHTADARMGFIKSKNLGYGQEHQLLVGKLEMFNNLESIRSTYEPEYQELGISDLRGIKSDLESISGNTGNRFQIRSIAGLSKDTKQELINSESLEEYLSLAGHQTDDKTMAYAWNVYIQNANLESLQDKNISMTWNGSQAQKDIFLGVMKADTALQNMNTEQQSRFNETLDLINQQNNQDADNQDSLNLPMNMMPDTSSDTLVSDSPKFNEIVSSLDSAFAKDDPVNNEIKNMVSNDSTTVTPLQKFQNLKDRYPITEIEINDSLSLVQQGLDADVVSDILVLYHNMDDNYKNKVPFDKYFKIYSRSKYGEDLNFKK